MRVASNTLPDAVLDTVGRLASRRQALQNQISTGQRIGQVSQDPRVAGAALNLLADAKNLRQYDRNLQEHLGVAQLTFGSVRSLKQVSERANEIALLVDDTKSPEDLQLFADEVTQMIQQAARIMNSKHQGNYLFGGTASNQPPFKVTEGEGGRVIKVQYQGNTSVLKSEISEALTISGQTLGANPDGIGPRGLVKDPRSGVDLFQHLIDLQDHLLEGNVDVVQTQDRPNLDADDENVVLQLAENGAMQARLKTFSSAIQERQLSLSTAVSNKLDVDLTESIIELNQNQNAFTASMQTAARILNQSLLDFL